MINMGTCTLSAGSMEGLLETLRIKYQHKASYDSMLSVFYGLQMTSAEDCAAFSSTLEQKLSYVQAMYPEELNTKQYWHLLRARFFHGLPVNLKTNIRSEYEKGVDYYPLLQAARMIESELRADPQFKTVDKTELKGDKKPKAKGLLLICLVLTKIDSLERHGVRQLMR